MAAQKHNNTKMKKYRKHRRIIKTIKSEHSSTMKKRNGAHKQILFVDFEGHNKIVHFLAGTFPRTDLAAAYNDVV